MTHIEINVGTKQYIVPLSGIYLTGEKSSRINLVGVGGFDVTEEEYTRVRELLTKSEADR